MKKPKAFLFCGLLAGAFAFTRAAPAASVDPKPTTPGAATGAPVTFTKDVAPIVFENCAVCHRPGEVAPFSLLSYKEVKKHASQIADVTESRYMPPWKPEPGHGDFQGSRRMTEKQVKTVQDWVAQGAPEGDPAALPAMPKFASGWRLGEPDLVVKMNEPYTLRAEGRDEQRSFVIPLNLSEDKYVTAVEFRPSNPKIVHHALFFLDNSGQARKLDEQDRAPGFARRGFGFVPSGGLGGWVPGVTPRFLPDGIGREVRKGADLVVQVHFHSDGKPEPEQSTIGLFFAKKKPEYVLATHMQVANPFKLNIKPGEKDFVIDDEFTTPSETTLVGISPHAHLVCKEIKVDATYPDGTEHPLIWIKDWDWGWQDQYLYQQQIKVPAGTKVKLHYVYDNSTENVKNPNNPPKQVHWGEQTADEMAITFFNYVTEPGANPFAMRGRFGNGGRRAAGGAGNGDGKAPAAAGPFGRLDPDGPIMKGLLERFDKNHNGKLDPDEVEEAKTTLRKELLGE